MASHSVALVHDYLLVLRGAERTFAAMAECWPDAPIYTLLYDEQGTRGRFADREVHTSYLQRLGVGQRGFRALLPVFPRATRALPLDRYDLIVSSSSAFAHGVVRSPTANHVCYCHTPFRYAWFERERALGEAPAPLRRPLERTLRRVREADRRASRQVTRYVANSSITQERIRAYWGRGSNVVHPPVEVERFRPREKDPESFFLVVTELVRHKQVDLALEAATRAGVPIWVVGEGPERARLEGRYGQAKFLGRVDDAELARLYARARALVLPNVEEFGIAAVEAQAAGRPVVAAAAGGALETVLNGQTGLLVEPGSAEAFASALAETEFARFDPELICRHAQGFSEAVFKQRLRTEVESAMGDLPSKGSQVPRAAASIDS